MTPFYSPVTLGQQVTQFDAGVFGLTEAAYSPTRALPRHAHECATISFVLKGVCTEVVARDAFECVPFAPIMKPAGVLHSNRYGVDGTKCLLIEIKPGGLEMIRRFSRVLDDVVHIQDGAVVGLAMRIHKEFQIRDGASALSIEGLVLEMVGAAARRGTEVASPSVPPWLRAAKELLLEQFKEQISLFDVAAAVGVNPSYLSRMFRKHYKYTVGEFVRRLRLEYAATRIAQSNDSIAQIAASAGFYDQSHFSHAFKTHSGVTPAEFRAALHKK
jgi:AraC family transcriptional regulator